MKVLKCPSLPLNTLKHAVTAARPAKSVFRPIGVTLLTVFIRRRSHVNDLSLHFNDGGGQNDACSDDRENVSIAGIVAAAK